MGLVRDRKIDVQIRREQRILRKQRLATHASEIVEKRHENRRCVLMAGAQIVQVLAQLQDAAQQEFTHLLFGVTGLGTLQYAAQTLHFFQ